MIEKRYIVLNNKFIISADETLPLKAIEEFLWSFDEKYYPRGDVYSEHFIVLKKYGKNIELIWGNERCIYDDMDEVMIKFYDKFKELLLKYELFHAGVVAIDGFSIVLAGPSGAGKTTLTLGLVKEGFKFLADDDAVYDLKIGKFMPFSRETKILHKNGQKEYVHVGELYPYSVGAPSSPRYLFIMDKFSGIAREENNLIEKIDKTEAMLSLIKDGIVLTADFNRRFASCADIIKKALCFKLFHGNINDMISQIKEIVGAQECLLRT